MCISQTHLFKISCPLFTVVLLDSIIHDFLKYYIKSTDLSISLASHTCYCFQFVISQVTSPYNTWLLPWSCQLLRQGTGKPKRDCGCCQPHDTVWYMSLQYVVFLHTNRKELLFLLCYEENFIIFPASTIMI